MSKRAEKLALAFFVSLVASLGLAQCGVKLPPKPDHVQDGPLSQFEKRIEEDPNAPSDKDNQAEKNPDESR